jgi:hypothetical protein
MDINTNINKKRRTKTDKNRKKRRGYRYFGKRKTEHDHYKECRITELGTVTVDGKIRKGLTIFCRRQGWVFKTLSDGSLISDYLCNERCDLPAEMYQFKESSVRWGERHRKIFIHHNLPGNVGVVADVKDWFDDDNLDISFPEYGLLEGWVYDKETEIPVKGAEISVSSPYSEWGKLEYKLCCFDANEKVLRKLAKTYTNKDGFFRLALLPRSPEHIFNPDRDKKYIRKRYKVSANASEYYYESQRVYIYPGKTTQVVFYLEPIEKVYAVFGRVQDEKSKVPEGISMRVCERGHDRATLIRVVPNRNTGEFCIKGCFRRNEYSLTLKIFAWSKNLQIKRVEIPISPGDNIKDVTLILDTPGLVIKGKVVDDRGNPLPGTEIFLGTSEIGYPSFNLKTDKNGEFRFTWLEEIEYQLRPSPKVVIYDSKTGRKEVLYLKDPPENKLPIFVKPPKNNIAIKYTRRKPLQDKN